MLDAEEFVRVLRPALRRASSIARTLEGRVRNRPKRGEASATKAALTMADSAAQEALLVPLYEHFPEVGLAAEENTGSVHRFPARRDLLVVVDPIDGTLRSYLQGLGPYAVMMGLAVAGRYEAALVALPREGLFFEAVRARGARVSAGRSKPGPIRFDPAARSVMISYEAPRAAHDWLLDRGYQPVPGCGGAIAVAPCIPGFCAGLRFATGPQGISERGRIGLLVSHEAGAVSACESSRPFPSALDAPAAALLVARDEATLADLREALAAGEPSVHAGA